MSPADVRAAVLAAEAQAYTEHTAGRCGDSEWSCSWCEDAAGGVV